MDQPFLFTPTIGKEIGRRAFKPSIRMEQPALLTSVHSFSSRLVSYVGKTAVIKQTMPEKTKAADGEKYEHDLRTCPHRPSCGRG